jgi:hypothetical protein
LCLMSVGMDLHLSPFYTTISSKVGTSQNEEVHVSFVVIL